MNVEPKFDPNFDGDEQHRTIHDLIHAAVHSRRLLRLNYHNYSRVAEPRVLAVDHTGQKVLIAWQISGGTESGAATGWKEFQIVEIAGVVVLPDGFKLDRSPPPLRASRRAGTKRRKPPSVQAGRTD